MKVRKSFVRDLFDLRTIGYIFEGHEYKAAAPAEISADDYSAFEYLLGGFLILGGSHQMRTLFTYIRPKAGIMAFEMSIKLIGTLIELLLPWMLSVILDDLVPVRDIRGIVCWGLMMIVCALLAYVTNVAANRISCGTSRDITERIRRDLFKKVTELSVAQTEELTIPSLISRLTSDTYNVHQMVDRMQRLGVRAPILLIGGIALTFSMEPVLTLVLLFILPLLGLLVFFVSRNGIRLYTRTQEALDMMVRRTQESIGGIRVIKALSKGDYEEERFDAANTEVVDRDRKASMLMNITNPMMNLMLNSGLTLVVVIGAYRVNAGVTKPGTIIAFLSYFTIILNALMMVSRLFVMYSKGAAGAKRIEEVLTAPEGMKLWDEQELGSAQELPEISFSHVTFSYSKVEDDISDISFSLKKGETLGIIGPTGSGKSTILNLLLRFYDPERGSICIKGRDIRTIPEQELHSMFGVVFQNDFLYSDTIGDNISFGRDISEEAIGRAMDMAQADFIYEKSSGLSELLSPGGKNLSGGQKQRVLLSRAFAGEPEILLLDDSSSALDYKTDALLRRAIGGGFKDKTKIIVAQRVSSIKNADHILVLEGGREIGYGTHEELMETCESYREIAHIQMEEVE